MNLKKEALLNSKLYAIFGPEDKDPRALQVRVPQALEGGVDIIQYRSKTEDFGIRLKEAELMRSLISGEKNLFIVNDDPQLAKMVRADGIHVGQEDMPIHMVKKIVGKQMLVGKSTHSIDQAKNAANEGADYIGFGPLFGTPTKPDYKPIGTQDLKVLKQTLQIPYFAIGGINISNVEELIEQGADRVAVVRAISCAPDIFHAAERFKRHLRKGELCNLLEKI
jgi:thiamine-phosphate pyrophosphorylase